MISKFLPGSRYARAVPRLVFQAEMVEHPLRVVDQLPHLRRFRLHLQALSPGAPQLPGQRLLGRGYYGSYSSSKLVFTTCTSLSDIPTKLEGKLVALLPLRDGDSLPALTSDIFFFFVISDTFSVITFVR